MFISKEELDFIKEVSEDCRKLPWWFSTKSYQEALTPDKAISLVKEIEYLKGIVESFQKTGCAGLIPNTWIMCGEYDAKDVKENAQYCSDRCWEEARIKADLEDLDDCKNPKCQEKLDGLYDDLDQSRLE